MSSVESSNGRIVVEGANLITPSSMICGSIVDNVLFGNGVDKYGMVTFVALFGSLKHVGPGAAEVTSVGGMANNEVVFCPWLVVLDVGESVV